MGGRLWVVEWFMYERRGEENEWRWDGGGSGWVKVSGGGSWWVKVVKS